MQLSTTAITLSILSNGHTVEIFLAQMAVEHYMSLVFCRSSPAN